jgi:hypothetical protein
MCAQSVLGNGRERPRAGSAYPGRASAGNDLQRGKEKMVVPASRSGLLVSQGRMVRRSSGEYE